MCKPIIAPNESEHKPLLRFYRINALCYHTGTLLHIANGVVTVDGAAYLGQIRADADDPTSYTVAAFTTRDGYGVPAPAGWEASVIRDDPPPTGGGLLLPFTARYIMQEVRAA